MKRGGGMASSLKCVISFLKSIRSKWILSQYEIWQEMMTMCTVKMQKSTTQTLRFLYYILISLKSGSWQKHPQGWRRHRRSDVTDMNTFNVFVLWWGWLLKYSTSVNEADAKSRAMDWTPFWTKDNFDVHRCRYQLMLVPTSINVSTNIADGRSGGGAFVGNPL